MKSKILLILIFMAVAGFAQVPEIVRQECYNFTDHFDDDKITSILPTDNGFIMTVEVYSDTNLPNFHALFDIMVVRTDTLGQVLWEKCYGGYRDDYPRKIINAGDNEYYVLGWTNSTNGDVQSGNNGGLDFWVFKIDGNGMLLWEKTYGSIRNDHSKDIILLPESGFLITGEISDGGGDVGTYYGDWDIWLCRCDSEGNILQEKTLGNEGEDVVNGLLLNSEGNILLTGAVETTGGTVTCEPKGMKDVWLAELDMQLQVLWDHCYGGSWDDIGYTLTEQEDGYLVLASTHPSEGWIYPGYDIFTVRIDSLHNVLWQKRIGGNYDDIPAVVYMDNEENYTIFGSTYSNDGDVSGNHQIQDNTSDIWIVNLSPGGDILWQHCYGGVGNELLMSPFTVIKKDRYTFDIVAQTDMENSYDVQCDFGEDVYKNGWFIEMEKCPGYHPETPETPSGPDTICTQNQQEHTYTIPPPANAWTFEWQLEPDSAGTLTNYGLYAVVHWDPAWEGTATVSARCANYCAVSNWSEPKYTEVQTCLGTEEIPAETTALRVYPNPAKDWAAFNYTLPNNKTKGVIKIVDTKGVFITSFTITGKAGQKIWDTRKLKPGIYFYTLNVSEYSRSGKIVISK